MIVDEVFAATVGSSTASVLIGCPSAAPGSNQVAIFDRATARARAAGLRLPRRFYTRWVAGSPGACQGAARRDTRGNITVYLSVDARPDELELTVLHQLAHVFDLARPPQGRSVVELEQRAENFVMRVRGLCA